MVTFHMDTAEDVDLFEYTKNSLLSSLSSLHKMKEINPSKFVYEKHMSKEQQKIHDLLMYNVEKYECPICYDIIDSQNETITDCNHKFCKTCMNTLQKQVCQTHPCICPCCRHKIKFYDITFMGPYSITILLIFHYKLHAFSHKIHSNDKCRYPAKWKFIRFSQNKV